MANDLMQPVSVWPFVAPSVAKPVGQDRGGRLACDLQGSEARPPARADRATRSDEIETGHQIGAGVAVEPDSMVAVINVKAQLGPAGDIHRAQVR
jgi:hypothetical protein